MTWADRFAAVIEDEAGQELLEAEWRAAYVQAFLAIALRRGWNRENAASWPGELAEPALIDAYRFDWDPARAAAFDVEAFEEAACDRPAGPGRAPAIACPAMPFAPVITFDLAAPNRSCRFTIDAASLGAIPDLATPPDRYLRLCTALAQAIRTPASDADATILGGFALLVLFAHPTHGEDARQSLGEALRAFDAIMIAVLINADGIAFSIGTDGDVDDLRHRLANLEAPAESGQVGSWPRAQAAH